MVHFEHLYLEHLYLEHLYLEHLYLEHLYLLLQRFLQTSTLNVLQLSRQLSLFFIHTSTGPVEHIFYVMPMMAATVAAKVAVMMAVMMAVTRRLLQQLLR